MENRDIILCILPYALAEEVILLVPCICLSVGLSVKALKASVTVRHHQEQGQSC